MYLPDQPLAPARNQSTQAVNAKMVDEPKPEPKIGLNMLERAAKRLFDMASVLVILVLFWWVIIGVAIAVRLTTGSPVIYGHKRIGRNGREFKCYKFRSMVPNADEVLAHLLATDAQAREEWSRDFKLKDDPRITRVGRFIRKTSFDEFPQLWNVVVNDMSIVGPRPVVRKELDTYYTGMFKAHYVSVKPGLTGLWQVSGRNDMDYAERVALDRSYVVGWGLWSDFMIVMRTVGVMFRRKGAY
jgi:lipopolysaccharide/colanic/teichoic acid biosynthesis glycosyltransferase